MRATPENPRARSAPRLLNAGPMLFARVLPDPTRHRTSSRTSSRPSSVPFLRTASLLALLIAVAPAAASAHAADAAASATDAIASACPCTGPAIGGSWRSHGQYVSCVTRAARRAARIVPLSGAEVRTIIRDGAHSSCGVSSREEPNVRVCATNPSLPCPTVRTAHVDDCAECSAALAGELVHCARVANDAGEQGDVCGTATRIGAFGKRAVDHRTGVDCASCKAKLGTPRVEGTDCVAALCDAFGGE